MLPYPVADRTAVTLLDIIQACIAPDMWASNHGFETLIVFINYIHQTVYHPENFADLTTGAHEIVLTRLQDAE